MAGFIGSHLYDRLTEEGHEVWGVDTFETSTIGIRPVDALDIADRHAFYQYANKVDPDLVIHCAASYKDPDKWHRDTDTNVTGTINTVLVAKHHGSRLVYFQTGLPPVSSYAISKIAGEQYIKISGVNHLIFRLANVYGPGNLSGPIPTFYKKIRDGEPCTVVDTSRDLVYVDDLIDAVMAAIQHGLGGVYDVCSGQKTSILDQWRAVRDALGADAEEPEVVAPAMNDVVPAVWPEFGVPGWEATTPIAEGVAQAVAWYQTNGVQQTYTHLARR